MNAENKTPLHDPLVLVHVRNQFYRGKFRFVLGVYILSLIANLVLISMIVYLIKHPTVSLYFPADKVGRLIQVIPVRLANQDNQDVVNWTVQAVEAAYSYDFMNYHGQLQSAQKYFTDYGWRNYMDALRASNNLIALTARKQIVITKVVGPPKLIKQALLGGAMAWKYEMPILVTFLEPPFTDKNKRFNAWVVTVLVRRENELQSYKGLGIVQMIARTAT